MNDENATPVEKTEVTPEIEVEPKVEETVEPIKEDEEELPIENPEAI